VGLFYKYSPLANSIVKNNPLLKLLSKLAWRKEKIVTRVSFRHSVRRTFNSAMWTGGRLFQPKPLAEGGGAHGLRPAEGASVAGGLSNRTVSIHCQKKVVASFNCMMHAHTMS
jgi:hypothetical protein